MLFRSSIDGWAFPQVFLTDTLRPEQTVSYEWLAPTTPMEPSGILLKPGTYNAIAVATLLSDKYSPSPKMVKEFMIMP